jgi:hypothetical protein
MRKQRRFSCLNVRSGNDHESPEKNVQVEFELRAVFHPQFSPKPEKRVMSRQSSHAGIGESGAPRGCVSTATGHAVRRESFRANARRHKICPLIPFRGER